MMCEQQHKNCDKKGQKGKLTSPIENWDEARKLRWWWHDVTSDNPRQPPYPNSIIIGRGGDGIMMCEQQRKKCDKKGQKEKLTSNQRAAKRDVCNMGVLKALRAAGRWSSCLLFGRRGLVRREGVPVWIPMVRHK